MTIFVYEDIKKKENEIVMGHFNAIVVVVLVVVVWKNV